MCPPPVNVASVSAGHDHLLVRLLPTTIVQLYAPSLVAKQVNNSCTIVGQINAIASAACYHNPLGEVRG